MKLCDELDMLPAQNLVPSIQLSVYAATVAADAAVPKRPRIENEPPSHSGQLVKDEGEFIEAQLVPHDLALQVCRSRRLVGQQIDTDLQC